MEKKLYVGGLSYNTTEQTLQSAFEQVGEVVSVNIITDRETGRSKGFGFVEMATEDAAQAAIEKYNGQEFEGRRLTVNEAKPQAPRNGGGGGGRGHGGPRGGGSRGGFGGGSGGNRNRW
jgi:RNA recognition motif-containing protein